VVSDVTLDSRTVAQIMALAGAHIEDAGDLGVIARDVMPKLGTHISTDVDELLDEARAILGSVLSLGVLNPHGLTLPRVENLFARLGGTR
jgi:hypothetical protein